MLLVLKWDRNCQYKLPATLAGEVKKLDSFLFPGVIYLSVHWQYALIMMRYEIIKSAQPNAIRYINTCNHHYPGASTAAAALTLKGHQMVLRLDWSDGKDDDGWEVAKLESVLWLSQIPRNPISSPFCPLGIHLKVCSREFRVIGIVIDLCQSQRHHILLIIHTYWWDDTIRHTPLLSSEDEA